MLYEISGLTHEFMSDALGHHWAYDTMLSQSIDVQLPRITLIAQFV